MRKKTCKDCLHCSVDGGDVLCSGMPWHYPFGGSDTVTLDKEACEHFLERDKLTVFDRITASEETLAATVVYPDWAEYIGGDCWTSPFVERYHTKEEAIAATVAKLKEVDE